MVVPVQPVVEVPERRGDSDVVAPSIVLGEASVSGQVTAAPGGGLGAISSGPPVEGVSRAVVQRGVPEEFIRTEHEEEEIW